MRILVATDLSSGADAALREAKLMARAGSDALGVIGVLAPRPDGSAIEPSVREEWRARIRERAARFIDRPVDVVVEVGKDYTEIIRHADAWCADLLVVGSHGQSGLWRALGHVTERVARYARCDVLVARASSSRGWVLAATDVMRPSLPVIRGGAEQAQRRRARLEVVNVLGFLGAEADYLFELATAGVSPARYDSDARLRVLDAETAKLGVASVNKILDPPAATAIVREAESIQAQLIVVGAAGRHGLLRIRRGGVGEKVMHAAHTSVLLKRLGNESAEESR